MCVAAQHGFTQFLHDMWRCGLVWVAHTEINNIFTARSRLLLQLADNIEDVRRQAPNALEIVIHDGVTPDYYSVGALLRVLFRGVYQSALRCFNAQNGSQFFGATIAGDILTIGGENGRGSVNAQLKT